jgi:hypothetical protein
MATQSSLRRAQQRELTLFIDESGDFQNVRRPWVLGGVLVAASRERAEELLSSHVHRVAPRLGLNRPADLHMTELAEGREPDESAAIAVEVLDCEQILGFVGIVNRRFRRIGLREGDYRLMVADLLVAASNAIGPSGHCRSLDLVIATRTIDGVRQTGEANINEALSAGSEMFARELVSRGLFELLDSNNTRVSLVSARSSWGLALADVFCNCLWISEIDRANPRGAIVKCARLAPRVQATVAYADARERRAENLRVEGQLGPSIAAWLLCERGEHRRRAIQSNMEEAFSPRTSSRGRLAVEAALETLHREESLSSRERSTLAAELGVIAADLPRGQQSALRCGVFAALHANHAGDSEASQIALQLSDSVVQAVRGEPEQWPRVAELELLRSEAFLNDLDLAHSWLAIRRHHDLIRSFGAAWELANDGSSDRFSDSAISVRAELAELRVGLWSEQISPLCVNRRLDAIAHCCESGGEASRFLCLSAAVHETGGWPMPRSQQLDQAAATDAWAAYWGLRLPLSLGRPALDVTVSAARYWSTRESLPAYLRAALLREVSFHGLRTLQSGFAARSADDSHSVANTAGRGSAATMLLDASVVAARAVATGSPWKWKYAGKCAPVDSRIAAAGILPGTPVTLEAALALRKDSVR